MAFEASRYLNNYATTFKTTLRKYDHLETNVIGPSTRKIDRLEHIVDVFLEEKKPVLGDINSRQDQHEGHHGHGQHPVAQEDAATENLAAWPEHKLEKK
jgi:hypothetical protein